MLDKNLIPLFDLLDPGIPEKWDPRPRMSIDGNPGPETPKMRIRIRDAKIFKWSLGPIKWDPRIGIQTISVDL